MRKKILSLGVTVFVSVGVILFGQKAEAPGYPFEVDKNIATAVFAKLTYDEVWGATLKALVAMGYTTTSSDKDAGIIKAAYIKVERVSTRWGYDILGRPDQYRGMAVKVDAQEGKVAVSLRWDSEAILMFIPAGANGKSYFSALYDKIAEVLYGETEKK